MRFNTNKTLRTLIAAAAVLFAFTSCAQLGLEDDSDDSELFALLGLAVLNASTCTDNTCKTFLTSGIFAPSSGFSAADPFCAADANKPSTGGTYKAFMAMANVRVACTTANCSGGISENTNWILHPNTKYVRSDGTTEIFTTNSSGIFEFGTATNGATGTTDGYLTGLDADWTVGPNCDDYTDTSSSFKFTFGDANITNSQMISATEASCDDMASTSAVKLLCVEQQSQCDFPS